MLDEKLKAETLMACFVHQTGFAPDNVIELDNGESCVIGKGYGLAWSWPSVRVIDEVAFKEFQAGIDSVLARFRRDKELRQESVNQDKAEKAEKQMEIFK